MLHHLHANKLVWIVYRSYIIIHALAVSLFLYNRAASLLPTSTTTTSPTLPTLVIFLAEIFLFFTWLAERAYRWRPVWRSVEGVENLSEEEEKALPAIDVFICTADPEKEPTVEVMNTLISAMALDYPSDRLNVYLSDDGGAEVTLTGAKEAWSFATWWVPFCRKYRLKSRCPEVYFEEEGEGGLIGDEIKLLDGDFANKFKQDKQQIKEKYEFFKERVLNNQQRSRQRKSSSRDHPPVVEVINENCTIEGAAFNPQHVTDMPLLVYVAREKRPSHPHHFKAGNLNTLLRVSGLLSNAPIVLVLDCDMYCNDPTSAKLAVCFHMDPKISPTLAFVQFPQMFRNVTKNDIYDSALKQPFKVLWYGIDGLQGPILSGTGFYIKRKALYDSSMKGLDNLVDRRRCFGSSITFLKTVCGEREFDIKDSRNPSPTLKEEAHFLASCKYEDKTKWGDEVGFMYHSLVEDFFTGYTLHINGWKSVYYDPPRAQFLGTAVTNLNDNLTQGTRWSAGLVEVGLSKFCPLIYNLSSPIMFLQRVCYAWLGLYPLAFLPIWCFAIIPQLCLFHGISIYPTVSSSSFPLIVYIFASSLVKNLYEVLFVWDSPFVVWLSQWRMWMIKGLTSHAYGSLDAIMKNLGLREASFIPTNKFMDDEQVKRYQQGVYDFQTSNMFLVPVGATVILNLTCLVIGVIRVMMYDNWDEMFAQVFLSGFLLIMSWPVIEGMFFRKDRGSISVSATIRSFIVSTLIVLASSVISQYQLA